MTRQAAHKIRVFVVDDHPSVRRGLRLLLGQDPQFIVCGEAGNLSEARTGIRAAKPDIVTLDLRLGEEDGLDLIEELHARRHHPRILVYTMHDQMLLAEKALAMGAHGYLVKSEPPQKVLEAIRAIVHGACYLSPAVDRTLLDAGADLQWMFENGAWTVRPRAHQ